jgi:hypothetical protein
MESLYCQTKAKILQNIIYRSLTLTPQQIQYQAIMISPMISYLLLQWKMITIPRLKLMPTMGLLRFKPAPTGKLIEQIKDLKTRFENGDKEAGYILAMNLRYCWRAPVDQKGFDARMQSAEDNHEVGAFIRRLEDSYEKCQGVDTTQKQQFYQIMQATAEQGYVPAQESYSQFNAEFYMASQDKKSLPRDEYIAEQKKFIAEKLNFLSRAAEQGSLKAMAKLANMYNSQNYGEKGWIKAYAYNQAILRFTDDNVLYRRYQWYIEKLTKNMTADEIAQAQALSLQLTTTIDANGTLYHIR